MPHPRGSQHTSGRRASALNRRRLKPRRPVWHIIPARNEGFIEKESICSSCRSIFTSSPRTSRALSPRRSRTRPTRARNRAAGSSTCSSIRKTGRRGCSTKCTWTKGRSTRTSRPRTSRNTSPKPSASSPRASATCGSAPRLDCTHSRGQEIYRIGHHHRVHCSRAEIELFDAQEHLALEIGRAQLARDELAVQYLPRGRDRELHNDLALESRVLAQRAVIERVDRTLVAIEDQLDVLDRARRLAAPAAPQRASAARAPASIAADDPLDHRGGTTRESAAAGIAAQGRGIDPAAAAGCIRSNQGARRKPRALAGTHARPGTGPDAGPRLDVLFKLCRNRRAAQIGELVFHRQQTHARGPAAGGRQPFPRRLRRFGFARFRDRRILRFRLRNFGLGLRRRFGFRLPDYRRRRSRLAFEQQLGEPRRQLLLLVAIHFRDRQPRHDQTEEDANEQHALEDAAEVPLFLLGNRPRQHPGTVISEARGHYALPFWITAKEMSL